MLSNARKFNNRNQNNNFTGLNSINSRIAQFYNTNLGEYSSTLEIGGWNDLITIKISPPLPNLKDDINFDYNDSRIFSITNEQAYLILQGINKLERSLKNKDKSFNSFAIRGGKLGNKFLKIGYNDETIEGFYRGFKNLFYIAIMEFDERKIYDELDKIIHFFRGKSFKNNNNLLYNNFNEAEIKKSLSKENITRYSSDWNVFKNIVKSISENGITSTIHGVNLITSNKFNKVINLIGDSSNRNKFSRVQKKYDSKDIFNDNDDSPNTNSYEENEEDINNKSSRRSSKNKKRVKSVNNITDLEAELE